MQPLRARVPRRRGRPAGRVVQRAGGADARGAPPQTLDEVLDQMTRYNVLPSLIRYWTDSNAGPIIPPEYMHREVIKGSLAPVGRFGSPLATRTNVSTLHLYGAGLGALADWQARARGLPRRLAWLHCGLLAHAGAGGGAKAGNSAGSCAVAAAFESVHRRPGGGLFGSGAQGSWIRSQVVSGRRTHALCFCARALCSGRVAGGPAALGAEPSGARAAHGLPMPALPARAGARCAGCAVGRVCRGRDLYGGAAGRGRAAPRPRWGPAPAHALGPRPGLCMHTTVAAVLWVSLRLPRLHASQHGARPLCRRGGEHCQLVAACCRRAGEAAPSVAARTEVRRGAVDWSGGFCSRRFRGTPERAAQRPAGPRCSRTRASAGTALKARAVAMRGRRAGPERPGGALQVARGPRRPLRAVRRRAAGAVGVAHLLVRLL